MSRLLGLALFLCVAFAQAQDASIRIGGSTTALPIISSCAAHFMEKFGSWDKADASLKNDQTVVYVTGGGSGFGVKGLMNGTIDLGMVSRDLKDDEIKALGGPVQHVFARDAVAIATNNASPLAKTKQGLHHRRARRDLLRPDGAVLADRQRACRRSRWCCSRATRAAASTEIFQDRVMKQQRLAASRLQFPSTAALIKKLETNDAAIAFVSAGAVSQDSARAHLRGRRRHADAGEHRQRQVLAQPADADRREAQSARARCSSSWTTCSATARPR